MAKNTTETTETTETAEFSQPKKRGNPLPTTGKRTAIWAASLAFAAVADIIKAAPDGISKEEVTALISKYSKEIAEHVANAHGKDKTVPVYRNPTLDRIKGLAARDGAPVGIAQRVYNELRTASKPYHDKDGEWVRKEELNLSSSEVFDVVSNALSPSGIEHALRQLV